LAIDTAMVTGVVKVPRVALVSTFPPAQCGIGNYSGELVRALARAAPDVNVVVLAESGPGIEDDSGVVRAWHRRASWTRQILAAVERARPDVVHVQHEEGILGRGPELSALCTELAAHGIRTIVTLHSVADDRRGRIFHRELVSVCDRVIVHQRIGMATVLSAHGVSDDRITVIAHGTPKLELPERAAAREMLQLPQDIPIALFFGFIHTGKRLHTAIAAFERAVREVPDAKLVVVGHMREDNIFQKIYARWLRGQMRAGIASGQIVFRSGFAPVEHKAAYYAAADIVVLPHVQAYGSASGVLHEAIAARRAFVCTRGNKFAEAVDALADQVPEAFPRAGDGAAWTRGLVALLRSEASRERMRQLAATLAESTSWAVSADQHAALYRSLASRAARTA
jgi:glycosyltransferase involved in cell wall biosynthesis